MNQQLRLPSFSPRDAARDAANSMRSPTDSENGSANFPFHPIELIAEQLECGGRDVTPSIDVRCDKGIFFADQGPKWTCYRRNYFAVTCSYQLHNIVSNEPLILTHNGCRYTVNALGVHLSASVDGPNGKGIELVQHTAKRDNGPKCPPKITRLSPSPGAVLHLQPFQGVSPNFSLMGNSYSPALPFQHLHDASDALLASVQGSGIGPQYHYPSAATAHLPMHGQNTQHTFDRIQFKQATANNGKRRASQQYFHLSVELWADIRQRVEQEPQWVKVAHRLSDKVIVRGRSPSHYRNALENGRNNRNNGGGGSGAGGYGFGNSANVGGSFNPFQHSQAGPSNPSMYQYSGFDGGCFGGGRVLQTIPEDETFGGVQKFENAYGGHQQMVAMTAAEFNYGMNSTEDTSFMTMPMRIVNPSPVFSPSAWHIHQAAQQSADVKPPVHNGGMYFGSCNSPTPSSSFAPTTPSSAHSGTMHSPP